MTIGCESEAPMPSSEWPDETVPKYRDGIEAQADYRIKKGAKEARRRNARLVAARRAVRDVGAVDFACCPVHGLHGQRNECYVCGEEVEIVAMVPVAERDALLAEDERLRGALMHFRNRLLVFAPLAADMIAEIEAALTADVSRSTEVQGKPT